MSRKRAHATGLIGVLLIMSSCERGGEQTVISPSQATLSTGTGLKAEYFNGMAFETPVLTRTDGTVSFEWASGSPGTGIPVDRFSVRWTGQIEPVHTETYSFHTQSDDGIRLWVNGRQLINNWTDHAVAENRGSIALTAGQRYDVKLEYYENSGGAIAKLFWSSARTPKQIVPQAQLYAASVGACGTANQDGSMTLVCPSGQVVSKVAFASYGNPSGTCGAFTLGTCNASSSVAVVSSACVGRSTCRVSANEATFGDPCAGTTKRLYAQVICNVPTGTGGATGTGGSPATGTGGSPAMGTGGRAVTGTGGAIATGTGGSQTTGTGGSAADTGSGLLAEYYNGMSFETLVLTQVDPAVNFDWSSGAPDSRLNADQFSVRWTGQVQPLYSETYTFSTQADDGARLWVNGQQLIDAWADYSPVNNSGTIALTAGQKYDLRLEYREHGGGAIARLSWSSNSQAAEVVPSARLYPVANARAGTGGSTGTGGRPGTGGVSGKGGAGQGTGGSVGAGGSTGAGNTVGTGGRSGTGGSTGAGAGTGNCSYSKTLRLIGNQIRDTSNTAVVARGPELVTASLEDAGAIDAAAEQGANAIRMLLTLDAINGMTPATFDTLVGRAVSHNMIIWLSLFTWDTDNNYVIGSALGGGNFYSLSSPAEGTCSKATPATCFLAVWGRQWLKDLVAKYQGHVIIDAGQEYIGISDASTEAGRTEWANAAQINVRWFRSAGYTVPLEIMSNYQGRDLYAIVQKGAAIRAVDNVVVDGHAQTMFGWQAYWFSDWYKSWQGGLLLGGSNSITGAQAIHQFAVTQDFPIQIGFDNYGGDTASEYKAQMDQAAADKASWLWWAWTGSNRPECPVDGATCEAYVLDSASGFAGAVRSACGL